MEEDDVAEAEVDEGLDEETASVVDTTFTFVDAGDVVDAGDGFMDVDSDDLQSPKPA